MGPFLDSRILQITVDTPVTYFYKKIDGWDPSGDKFEVYRNDWDATLIAIFFDELLAAQYVREKNAERR